MATINILLTVKNDDVKLNQQVILAYLRPVGASTNWLNVAWTKCSPQQGGGTQVLPPIINDVSAFANYNNNSSTTATKSIPLQNMSYIVEDGNVIALTEPKLDTQNLTVVQSGVKNTTKVKDIYPVWCVNALPVCRSAEPMYNNSFSSFELLPKVYFSVGSQTLTDTFIMQNWTDLQEFDLEPKLKSATVNCSVDKSTNAIVFTMSDQKYW